jgi:hypothetical protein
MKSFFEPDMKIIEDWLMDNIMKAEKDLIDESVGWFDIEDERLIFRITGSEFFDEEKDVTDVLKKDFDVIASLWDWFDDYIEHEDLSSYDMALIESIAKDLNDFATALNKKAGVPPTINEPT